ncbi:MAG: hypothetical protein IH597_01730 [Bacteroidales bacterium]|nr:hypothetical protein [Bacteroidales bacterium]
METLKELAGEIKETTGLEADKMAEIGLLNEKIARKWLVKHHYHSLKNEKERTLTDIKLDLSVKYDVSVSMIEKMVYRK